MAKESAETKLVRLMRADGDAEYGDRIQSIKFHGGPFTQAGVSDVLGCLDGVFFAVEVKSPESSTHKRATLAASIEHALTEGPTVKQRSFVAKVLAAGGVAGFAATREQFMEILKCAAERDSGFGGCGYQCSGHNLRPYLRP